MTITVDTSAVLVVAADEPTKPALIDVVRGADLVAPSSLHAEIGNALSAMFKRKRITLAEAHAVRVAADRIPIQTVPLDLVRALDLSHRLGIYAYDAYVLACALSTRTPLLSLDRGQRAAAHTLGIPLLDLPSP